MLASGLSLIPVEASHDPNTTGDVQDVISEVADQYTRLVQLSHETLVVSDRGSMDVSESSL